METKEYSKSKPISVVTVQINSEKIHELIRKIRNEENYNINFSDIVVSNICKNLQNFREFNSNFNGKMIPYTSIDMGYFINLGKGSEIINIKEADKKSLIELSKKIKEMALKYLHGELSNEEKGNGSFSITNLSSFDVYSIIPPLYENQSAMISISSEFESFERKEGEIVPVKKFNLTLSYDSRVADCQKAAEFLNLVRKKLECLGKSIPPIY
jgi:pyruvate dehydrogenase E2 component (dihydrolipoamide acetyltransferase)